MDRRQFVARGSLLAAGLAVGCTPSGRVVLPEAVPRADAAIRDLALLALDAARAAGAEYADVRISRTRNQFVGTREQRVTNLADDETFGFGVRVLVNGVWGFAASRDLTATEVARVARLAAAQARANQVARSRRVELSPVEVYPDGRWRSPIEIDPFEVPIEDKVNLLLRANAAALGVDGARFVTSSLAFVGEEKTFASTEGTFTHQQIFRC